MLDVNPIRPTTINRSFVWPLALVAALAVGLSCPARAAYPDKPITLIVPFAAGGANNAIARIVAPEMTALLGQSVVVDNRPGASGALGSDQVAKSPPDGYTE